MTRLDETRVMALKFIKLHGSDCVGPVDSEEKLAVALLYDDMRRDGLLIAFMSDQGPVYRLTSAGRAALKEQA